MSTSYSAEELLKFETAVREHAPAYPSADDLKIAAPLLSVAAAGAPEGMLLSLVIGEHQLKLFLNPVVAQELATQIFRAGELGTWWDRHQRILPRIE